MSSVSTQTSTCDHTKGVPDLFHQNHGSKRKHILGVTSGEVMSSISGSSCAYLSVEDAENISKTIEQHLSL
jgi:hypothetical protein